MTEHDHGKESQGRVTAPMQEFTGREVGIGLLVFLVGVAVAFLLPALAI